MSDRDQRPAAPHDVDRPPGGRSTSAKAILRDIFGFAISGALLWLTIRQSGLELRAIDFSQLVHLYYLAAEVLFILAVVIYAVRARIVWQSQIVPSARISTFASIALGNFYSSVLPANLGEGVRAWHFAQRNTVLFTRSLAAIITEKWLDAQMFVFLAVLLLCLRPFDPDYILYSILGTAAVTVVLSVIYFVMRRSRPVERIVWRIPLLLGRAGRVLYMLYRATCDHIDNVNKNRQLPSYLAWCLTIFSLNIIQFYFLMKAAGVRAPICDFYTSLLVAISMMIIAIIPSAPGNIGVLHYGVYAGLVLSARVHGITTSAADLQSFAVFGIYTHLSYFLPDVVIGAIYIWRERDVLFEKPSFKGYPSD